LENAITKQKMKVFIYLFLIWNFSPFWIPLLTFFKMFHSSVSLVSTFSCCSVLYQSHQLLIRFESLECYSKSTGRYMSFWTNIRLQSWMQFFTYCVCLIEEVVNEQCYVLRVIGCIHKNIPKEIVSQLSSTLL
jgi:hypothetical protein